MTEARFDALIHVPARLSIMALLAPAKGVQFRFLRDHLQLSDSALSKHLTALQTAGYVTAHKQGLGNGSRTTWLDLTRAGLTAFEGHVAALEEMLYTRHDPPA